MREKEREKEKEIARERKIERDPLERDRGRVIEELAQKHTVGFPPQIGFQTAAHYSRQPGALVRSIWYYYDPF